MDSTDVSEQTNLSAGGDVAAGAVAELSPAAPASGQETPTAADTDPIAAVAAPATNGAGPEAGPVVAEAASVAVAEGPDPAVATAEPELTMEAALAAMDVGELNGTEGATATATTEPELTMESAMAAMDGGDLNAAQMMEQFLNDPTHDYKSLKYGDVMDGIIMHVDREELLVDIGSKSEGIVPAREYSSLSQEEKSALGVGDQILVFVVQPENQEGHAVVSIDRARQEKSWRRLQEQFEANEVIEAEVTNYNKGGLLVNLDGVRGFVPASQVTEIRGGDEASKQADMARLIGTNLSLKVIEINRHRNRLILSERQAVQERRDVMKERLIGELKEGEVRKGRVSSICDFGAFVDIGGADGLVHLSELSWSRVRHPSEVLRVGQEIDVYVLGINAQEKKIALSIKRTQAEPWSRVAANYEVSQLVRGTVTQLANFGAFARIEDGIEGLVHVSELVDERVTHPKQVVSEGTELLLRIIRIDPQRRRMGLSLRRALDTPDSDLVAVFGPEVVEERDALVQEIRRRLEAEGLDGATALTGPSPTSEVGEADSGTEQRGEPSTAATPVEPANPLQAFEARMAAARQREQQPSRPRPQDRPRSQSAAPEVATEMSAMELAFAMAGAAADLVENAAAGDEAAAEAIIAAPAGSTETTATAAPATETDSEAVAAAPSGEVGAAPASAEASSPETPAEASAATVEAEPTTETAADPASAVSSEEIEPTESDDSSGGGSAVGALAGAIAGRIESVAETVASRVSGVVEEVVDAVRLDASGDSNGGGDPEAAEAGPEPGSAPEPESVAADEGRDRAS